MNDYQKTLPFTGAGLTIGSLTISEPWLAVIGASLVFIGFACIRMGFRRGKSAIES